jgi:hypothetical protein
MSWTLSSRDPSAHGTGRKELAGCGPRLATACRPSPMTRQPDTGPTRRGPPRQTPRPKAAEWPSGVLRQRQWPRIGRVKNSPRLGFDPLESSETPDSIGFLKWWLGAELNRRHKDFQSSALPTELPSQPPTNPPPRFARAGRGPVPAATPAQLARTQPQDASPEKDGRWRRMAPRARP